MHRWRLLLLPAAVGLAACTGGTSGDTSSGSGGTSSEGTGTAGTASGGPSVDLCTHAAAPAAEIGRSIGDDFTPYAPNEEVELVVAPQGGYGVPVSVRTEGLRARGTSGETPWVDADLQVIYQGAPSGSFYDGGPLGCLGPGRGGLVSGLVAGFDPSIASTPNDLLALDGAVITVQIRLTDEDSVTVEAEQFLIVRAGG